MSSDLEEQQDEVLALLSIFDPEEFVQNEESSGEFRVCVELPRHFTVTLTEESRLRFHGNCVRAGHSGDDFLSHTLGSNPNSYALILKPVSSIRCRLSKGDALSKYEITSLPPLCLTFDLPEDYPSCSAPAYSLNCSWLTPMQLSSLAAQLDDLYQTTGGAVVLFSWAQFLKSEALGFLGITNVLEIPSNEDTTGEDGSAAELNNEENDLDELSPEEHTLENESASSEAADSDAGASNVARLEHGAPLSPGQVLLSRLLIHDAAQRQKVFCSQHFDCGVCFMTVLGADCVQLIECGHVFCQMCFAEFCKVHITNGSVKEVTCLEAGCRAAPTHAQVKSVVSEELFSRYDRLLLQATLDSMSDVMYCPRPSCASAVLGDTSSSMALCSVCAFAFCTRCKKTYHGTEACSTPIMRKSDDSDGQNPLIPHTNKGMTALWEDYTTADKEKKKLLEKWYGKKTLHTLLEDGLSKEWKSSNSKACPHCFTHIQKNGGCNTMTCSRCRLTFCWNCLAKSPGRVHRINCFDIDF